MFNLLLVLLLIIFLVIITRDANSKSTETMESIEHLTNLSNESLQNLGKVYNESQLTITDLNVTGKFNLLPKGMIVMWAGSVVPASWVLCDGTNGTPNLKDKFILGAGTQAIGATGGESQHTLTVDELPSHNHEIRVWGDPNGDPGTANATTFKLTDRQIHKYESWTNKACRDNHQAADNCATPPVQIQYTGGGKPHNNMPPYYALAYIMKL